MWSLLGREGDGGNRREERGGHGAGGRWGVAKDGKRNIERNTERKQKRFSVLERQRGRGGGERGGPGGQRGLEERPGRRGFGEKEEGRETGRKVSREPREGTQDKGRREGMGTRGRGAGNPPGPWGWCPQAGDLAPRDEETEMSRGQQAVSLGLRGPLQEHLKALIPPGPRPCPTGSRVLAQAPPLLPEADAHCWPQS